MERRGAGVPAASDRALTCTDRTRLPLYVVAEKILGAEETLPDEWLLAGTTGYDFLNSVGGLFVDPSGLDELIKVYGRFIDQRLDFREVAHQSKLLIFRTAMSSDLQLLAHRLNRISERHRRSRDFTLNTLRIALREIFACFPVYRTYIRAGLRFRARPAGRLPRGGAGETPQPGHRTPPCSTSFATCSCWKARRSWTKPAAASGSCSSAASSRSPAP